MNKDSTKGPRTSQKTGGKKKAAKKSAKQTAERALVEAQVDEFKQKVDPLSTAIEQSVGIMYDSLRGDTNIRDVATKFLICVSNRFDQIEGMKGLHHEQFGYEREYKDIRERLDHANRTKLPSGYSRLDRIISALVHEAKDLTQSQSTFCEQCEHCLRERYTHGFDAIGVGERFTTDDSVDDETWAYLIERFQDMSGSDGTNTLVVALKHIASMAWVSRPGAVRDRVNELVAALFKGSLNESELADQFASEQLAEVKESIRWNKEEGKNV
jgi:hypothetical protein